MNISGLYYLKVVTSVPSYSSHFRSLKNISGDIMRSLAVFDFDYTILNDNSDTAIFRLCDKGEIPQDLKKIRSTQGWTAFMQAVFTLLHKQGVKSDSIKSLVKNLPPVSGMTDLIRKLRNNNFDEIVISDSNSLFIQAWLDNHGLDDCIEKVFTNPAEIVDDTINISPYHIQNSCKLSTVNLCKGQILDDFVETQRQRGVVYDRIIYIGDGGNDFCPVLRLKRTDLACARKNYKLCELLEKATNIKSEVLVWETGDDILKRLDLKE